MKTGEKTNVLLVCAHRPRRSPSQRYRFEQYLDRLSERGFTFTFLPLLTEKEDLIFYSRAKTLRKALLLITTLLRRRRHARQVRNTDIVFIQREASFTGSTYFEKMAARRGAYVIFDFDDAIWLEDTSPGNKKWAWLKRPAKFFENVRLAGCVIAGNEYLASKARPLNRNTVVIPTTIDTNIHKPMPGLRNGPVVTIGWSGSISTLKHFEMLLPVLSKLMAEMPGTFRVKLIGAQGSYPQFPGLETVPWTEDSEVKELNTFDIGVMPLPDDEWSRGKCGLKGLSYMACGVAAVMSPVGVNTDIVRHGENGMLASGEAEWYSVLKLLIGDPVLRERLGEKGRHTVTEKYSSEANAPKYIRVFEEARKRGGR